MCGIDGIHVFDSNHGLRWSKFETAVDHLFGSIDHRGGDATGFVAVSDEETVWQKASCGAFDFYKERKQLPWGFRNVLLHTRMATQGSAAFPENNHPVRRGSVYIVHNGHIWNDYEVFNKKVKSDRYGQVDSEAIAAIISKYGIMRTHDAMEELSGAAAIGAIDSTNPGLMVLARGSSSPLMYYRNEHIAIFGSTKEAVKKAWKSLYGTGPKDKKIEDVREGIAIYLDEKEERRTFRPDDYYYSKATVVKATGGYVSSGSEYESWSNGHYNYTDPKVTVVSPYGGREIDDEIIAGLEHGLCRHFANYLDCEVCNPDDEHGSYLPELKKSGKAWINAHKCDLCEAWFGEDELLRVEDWEDKWVFCDSCMNEMSDVISACDMSKPVRIYDLSDEEIAKL